MPFFLFQTAFIQYAQISYSFRLCLNYSYPQIGVPDFFQQQNSPFFLCAHFCVCGFKSHLNIYRNIMLEIVLIEAEFNGPHKGEGHAIPQLIASRLGRRTLSHSSFWV